VKLTKVPRQTVRMLDVFPLPPCLSAPQLITRLEGEPVPWALRGLQAGDLHDFQGSVLNNNAGSLFKNYDDFTIVPAENQTEWGPFSPESCVTAQVAHPWGRSCLCVRRLCMSTWGPHCSSLLKCHILNVCLSLFQIWRWGQQACCGREWVCGAQEGGLSGVNRTWLPLPSYGRTATDPVLWVGLTLSLHFWKCLIKEAALSILLVGETSSNCNQWAG
jgi:hypothetical protein